MSSAVAVLLRLALVGYCLCGGGDRIGVPEIVVLDRLEILVELVDERDAGRDIEFYDRIIRYVIEIFDERT